MAFSIRRTRELGTVNTSVPAGAVMPFAGNTSPAGWLLCFGQAISRTEYSALFSVLGTAYGTGDGSTTFNLPDLRGRVVAGVDNMGGTAASRLTSTTITGGADAVGEVGGGQTHTLTTAEMPAHTHGSSWSQNFYSLGGTSAVSALPGASATFTTASTGSGGAHNNVQPTMVLNYIIKV
jgi:microcystin-dependent protein